jgi:hypothetical protein
MPLVLSPARTDTVPATCAEPVASNKAPLLLRDDAPVWIETPPLTPAALLPLLTLTLPLALVLSELETNTAPLDDPAPEDNDNAPPSPDAMPAVNPRAVPAPEPD